MFHAYVLAIGRFLAIVLAGAWIWSGQFVFAQGPDATSVGIGLIPLLSANPGGNPVSNALFQPPIVRQRRAPLARLVENPDQTDGAPPFALTDQTGTIQRYVEPVPGVDLASHVGQVVVVRHDTGPTLLASQLELPPSVSGANNNRYAVAAQPIANARRMREPSGTIEQVQYVDNDDATVQLLPDDISIPNGNPGTSGAMMPLEGMGPGGETGAFADPMGSRGLEAGACGQSYQPMQYGQAGMMAYPDQMIGPYPNCGGYPGGMGDRSRDGYGMTRDGGCPDRARLSADVELSWLRPQVAESSIGKLSEEYQFSPRIILGLRGVGNFDGRVRYWRYDRDSDVLSTNGDVRFKFDALDIEVLHRFVGPRSELALAAGIRLAGIHLTDVIDQKSGADFIGLTLAADGLSPLGLFPGGHFGLVYGGRVSILGGDWGGRSSQFIDQRTRNDNVLVHELYGGVELARRFSTANVHARLLFEMQNWKSDVLARDAGLESIGFFGPGLELGAEF